RARHQTISNRNYLQRRGRAFPDQLDLQRESSSTGNDPARGRELYTGASRADHALPVSGLGLLHARGFPPSKTQSGRAGRVVGGADRGGGKLEMSRNKNNIEDIYPLSSMQQGLLLHSVLAPDSGVYVQQLSCTLAGDLDLSALKRAWQKVVDRHPVLRTAFIWKRRAEPVQVVHRSIELSWEEHDWSGDSSEPLEDRLNAFLEKDRRSGFVLSKAPLIRINLIRVEARAYKFVWTHHHILMDGWCGPLLMKEVFAFYEAFSSGPEGRDLYIEPSRPYGDYIDWLGNVISQKRRLSGGKRSRDSLR